MKVLAMAFAVYLNREFGWDFGDIVNVLIHCGALIIVIIILYTVVRRMKKSLITLGRNIYHNSTYKAIQGIQKGKMQLMLALLAREILGELEKRGEVTTENREEMADYILNEIYSKENKEILDKILLNMSQEKAYEGDLAVLKNNIYKNFQ